ncbi:unnamed protein product [Rhodiola kirilowii]
MVECSDNHPTSPQEVDPLEKHPLHPDEGSPDVIEALQRLSRKEIRGGGIEDTSSPWAVCAEKGSESILCSGWKNDQYEPAPPLTDALHEVDPLDKLPDEGSPAVIEALRSLSGKVVLLTAKVANLELLYEKVVKKSVAGCEVELRAKMEAIESLPALMKEMEESAKINMIHGTQIKEEIKELNRQLRGAAPPALHALRRGVLLRRTERLHSRRKIAEVAHTEFGWDKAALIQFANEISNRLGLWAIPAYVAVHTLTLAFCLPYAVFFEAGASLLFGFFTAVLCVFAAKLLGASLSFWIGRLILKKSTSATKWAKSNKYFSMLSRGVERDGWKFVLLARFSPIPSYIINYALAATNVRFFKDFLFPTIIGCLPMILQNTSIGSLAGAAVASASGSQKSQIWSYVFPSLGIASSVLISLRIKKYSADIMVNDSSTNISPSSETISDSNLEGTSRKSQ